MLSKYLKGCSKYLKGCSKYLPVNILKDAIDTYLPILTKVFNSSIEQNEFPNELKLADVLPIYKKKMPLIKKIIGL